jgi:CO/xanthine dehydrogenase Mo-binding subunit
MTGLSRRALLKIVAASGGLVMACWGKVPPTSGAATADAATRINAWIRIDADETVTIRVAHTEIGQGIHTVLAILVAEELDIDVGRVRVEAAPVEPVYDNPLFHSMVTGESTSVVTSFDPLRVAGAGARIVLVTAAAARWGCLPSDCEASLGEVRNRLTGAVLSYGRLVEAAARLPLPPDIRLKPRSEWRLLGQPMRRIEGPDKVRGTALFGIDTSVPGMLTGTVRNCPVAGGKLRRVDPAPALAVPGVAKVVELVDAVVVVAGSFWAASKGLEALRPEWDAGSNADLSSAAVSVRLDKALGGDGIVVTERGSAEQSEAVVRSRLSLRYEAPLLGHAALEPLSATVAIDAHGVDVWAPTQVPTAARYAVAKELGVAPANVRVHTTLAGGSFGRKLQLDYILQAALAARASMRPVKLIWSRTEDLQHGFCRPPAIASIEIGLDQEGLPVRWNQRLATPDLRRSMQQFGAGPPAPGTIDPHAVEGATPLPYRIAYHRLSWHDAEIGLPLGWLRSVGHSFNAWFVEHTIDAIAHASGQDPIALRLRLLTDQPRHQAVLREAMRLWPGAPAPGRFRGAAVHESYGSVVAQCAEISLSGGRVAVHRVTCAIDCGQALNPGAVRAQMEGGIIFGLTAALYGEITVQNGAVQQRNFDDYRLLSARDTPEIVVAILNSDAALAGVGEAGVPPIAPALCNAILAATGSSVLRLPIRLG